MRAVRNKMWHEGYEPNELDNFQYQRVRFLAPNETPEGWADIWEGENTKYYKMLSAGVPVAGVHQKMTMDGVDATALDTELYERVQRKTREANEEYEEGKDVDELYHKVRFTLLKWMLCVIPSAYTDTLYNTVFCHASRG